MNIGLAGPPESGKNASADILTLLYGYQQASFAQALREEVRDILHGRMSIPKEIRDRAEYEQLRDLLLSQRGADPWKKPTPKPMRELLQLYGTEFRRAQDQDYWVKKVMLNGNTVVTDVRFANERIAVDQCWYIYRPQAEEKAGMYRHASEGNILPQDCDRILDNSGTLDQLEVRISEVLA